MTRDGLIEVNETKETTERISNREQDADFSKQTERTAPDSPKKRQKGRKPPIQEQTAKEPQPEVSGQPPQDKEPLSGAAASALPHVPGASKEPDTGKAERVMEHIDAAHTRKASKKAAKRAREAAAVKTPSSRLQFTDEERATPELEKYIEKADKAADRLDAAKAAIPKKKKLVKERTFEEALGKPKTRLHFEEQEKPIPGGKSTKNPLSRPAQEAGVFVHNKIHSVEKDNSGVEGAHKSEELAEKGAKYGTRKLKQGYRSHKLKPYRKAANDIVKIS